MSSSRSLRLRASAIALAIAATTALAACGGDDDSGGSISNEGNEELFTTSGFQEAYDAVKAEAGDDAGVLQLQITEAGANFKLRDGAAATGFVYTGGEVVDEEVELIGPGSIEGQDYPIAEIDPAAIDQIVEGIRAAEPTIDDLTITVMTLEKQATDGQLGWVVNAEGGGRTGLVYNADPDGSRVSSPTDSDSSSPNATGAAAILECVQAAGENPEKVAACAAQ